MMNRIYLKVTVLVATVSISATIHAQEYPTKPISFYVPTAGSGAAVLLAYTQISRPARWRKVRIAAMVARAHRQKQRQQQGDAKCSRQGGSIGLFGRRFLSEPYQGHFHYRGLSRARPSNPLAPGRACVVSYP